MGWTRRTVIAGLALSLMVACGASGEDDGRGFDDDGGGGEGGTTTTGSNADGGGSTGRDAAADTNAPPSDAAADVAIDVAPGGNPAGFPCATPGDCQSGECKNVLAGSATSVCVKPCTAQADCADNFFCDPETPGAASGFCAPRSPAHCKTCSASTECGSLSEVCGVAAGDTVKACHVDCTIAGAAACPPDYTCEATTLDGNAAKVCRPAGNLSCLDSLGGFCDRVATPQNCSRKNVAGTCVGQRTCLTASTRFDTCKASAPVCKLTCSTTDPAGCTTSYCPEATDSPSNCGTCGKVCPGLNKANAVVGCNQPTCTFACAGETYNVDNDDNDGCEVSDSATDNHTENTATDKGSHGCSDDDPIPTISGRIVSDSETHTPAIEGFVTATGSAPDYYTVVGSGSVTCVNNIDLTLNVNQAVSDYPTCYELYVRTNKNEYTCNTDANGNCRIAPDGSSKYDDGTDILIVVSKRNVTGCKTAQRDNAPYTITGHL